MSMQSPYDMTPEQVALALKNAHILETWIASVRSHAFDLLKSGTEVPGYKLGFGVRKRIWKPGQHEAAINALLKIGIPREDLFTKPEMLSPPKTEKLLRELGHWPRMHRGAAKPVTPIDPFIELSMPEPRVVPIDQHEEVVNKRVEAEREFSYVQSNI